MNSKKRGDNIFYFSSEEYYSKVQSKRIENLNKKKRIIDL
jgi:hypothetical protein